eukprot:GAHX01000853.1.p1 GENE.GAHX01000853.1~~GAHX01000853.1.p1  ORF type:complete len:1174 (+),score=273.75 GAHX01000853.1:181-3702(+)
MISKPNPKIAISGRWFDGIVLDSTKSDRTASVTDIPPEQLPITQENSISKEETPRKRAKTNKIEETSIAQPIIPTLRGINEEFRSYEWLDRVALDNLDIHPSKLPPTQPILNLNNKALFFTFKGSSLNKKKRSIFQLTKHAYNKHYKKTSITCTKATSIGHAKPAFELQQDLYPALIKKGQLINWHREFPDKLPAKSFIYTTSINEQMEETTNDIKHEITLNDLSASFGTTVIVERLEQYPISLLRTGMQTEFAFYPSFANKKCIYPDFKTKNYGSLEVSPFHTLLIERDLYSLNNSLSETMVVPRTMASNYYLLTKDKGNNLSLRKLCNVFVAGQTFSKTIINDAKSKKSKAYSKTKLKVYINKMLSMKRQISIEHLVECFPSIKEERIKIEIRKICEISKSTSGINWCYPKQNIKLSNEIISVLSADDFCSDESMKRCLSELTDFGIEFWKELKDYFENKMFKKGLTVKGEKAFMDNKLLENKVNNTVWKKSMDSDNVMNLRCFVSTMYPSHCSNNPFRPYRLHSSQSPEYKFFAFINNDFLNLKPFNFFNFKKMTKNEEALLKNIVVTPSLLTEELEVGKASKLDLLGMYVLIQPYKLNIKVNKISFSNPEIFYKNYNDISKVYLKEVNKKYLPLYKAIKSKVDAKIKRQIFFSSNDMNFLYNYYFRMHLCFNECLSFFGFKPEHRFISLYKEKQLSAAADVKSVDDLAEDLEQDLLESSFESEPEEEPVAQRKKPKIIKVKRKRLKRTTMVINKDGKEEAKVDYIYDPELIADFILDQKDAGDRLRERLGIISNEYKKLYSNTSLKEPLIISQSSVKRRPSAKTSKVTELDDETSHFDDRTRVYLAKKQQGNNKPVVVCNVCGMNEHKKKEECKGFQSLYNTTNKLKEAVDPRENRNELRIRKRGDPRLDLSLFLKKCLDKVYEHPQYLYFVKLPDKKIYPNYFDIIKDPVCLQDIKAKIQKLADEAIGYKTYTMAELKQGLGKQLYSTVESFLNDLKQIITNAILYNGETSALATWTDEIYNRAYELIESNRNTLNDLEKKTKELYKKMWIQPCLGEIVDTMRNFKHSLAFRNPVNCKVVPRYLEIIKKPIDLSTIKKKVNFFDYKNLKEFADDCKLLYTNSVKFNGERNLITLYAKGMLSEGQKKLEELTEYIESVDKISEDNLISV